MLCWHRWPTWGPERIRACMSRSVQNCPSRTPESLWSLPMGSLSFGITKAWIEIILFTIHHFTQHEIHSWNFHQWVVNKTTLVFNSGWSRGDGPLAFEKGLWLPRAWRLTAFNPGHGKGGSFLPGMNWQEEPSASLGLCVCTVYSRSSLPALQSPENTASF
uniref:Uncharacterized protein n=1 Tax=Molossus molossus TaxID=27622 RepID=A0A7J8B7I0_MOLMO|nr:hypothetical protein HJG59_010490 [Molossus molossus]